MPGPGRIIFGGIESHGYDQEYGLESSNAAHSPFQTSEMLRNIMCYPFSGS
jgi:hypothetical protein